MDAISRLRAVPFLEHLELEEFEALAEMMDLRPFLPGDKILTQGEPTTNFYVVDAGVVNLRVTDRGGHERAVGSKNPGEFFGVKMFTTQEPSEATFEAVERADMWVVERQDWEALLKKFPHVLEHMPELRAEYMRLTRGLAWLAPGEVIDLVTRPHPWSLLLTMRLPFFVALIFTIAFLISNALGVTQTLPWVLPVYGIALFACLLWAAYRALDWWNDVYIVTNKRVVHSDKVLFLSDSRNEIPIEKIQSQNVSRGGPISVLLNISDLRITSAASDTQGVIFAQVGDVQRIQRAITAQQQRVAERNSAAERERLRNQIKGQIRHYVLQQPTPPEKSKTPAPAPVSQRRRWIRPWRRRSKVVVKPPKKAGWGSNWKSLYGTEMREGKTVTWRKSHWALLKQIFWGLVALFAIIALGLFFLFGGIPPELSSSGVYSALLIFLVPALLYVTWQWADWRRDLYQLTETTIIDIDSLPFGMRYHEQKAELSKIQDIKTVRRGIINTLLDFGDVQVRVAGNAEPFTFDGVPRPHYVADEIAERMEILKLRGEERAARDQTRQIVDAIVAYHRLVTERDQAEARAAPSTHPPDEPVTPSSDATTSPATEVKVESAPPESEFPPGV